jgi:hypothetical protein
MTSICFQFHHEYSGIANVILKKLNFAQINKVTLTTEIMHIHNTQNPAEASSTTTHRTLQKLHHLLYSLSSVTSESVEKRKVTHKQTNKVKIKRNKQDSKDAKEKK